MHNNVKIETNIFLKRTKASREIWQSKVTYLKHMTRISDYNYTRNSELTIGEMRIWDSRSRQCCSNGPTWIILHFSQCLYVCINSRYKLLTEIYCYMCMQLISLSHDVFMRNSPITFPRHWYDRHKYKLYWSILDKIIRVD